MAMVQVLIEFILLGIAGGLLGLFYRNCLKAKGMLFNWLYYGILKPWAEIEEDLEECGLKATRWQKVLAFIAYPLGYCVYCSSTWITFFLCAIYLSGWEILPTWQTIVIGVVMASGVQHLIIVCTCRWILSNHPDRL